MTQAIATLTAAIGAFVFIGVGAYITQPEQPRGSMQLKQIKTDSTTHYATLASVGRCNFVEMTW